MTKKYLYEVGEVHAEAVKRMVLKLYREKGIKPECERCFIVTDPQCPDFPHICALETGLEEPGPDKDWILENLSPCIKMRELNKENCGRCKSYFETDDCIVEEVGKITAKRSVS